MKLNLFVALARCTPEPAARAITISDTLHYYGANRYILLDAWQAQDDLLDKLEVALIERVKYLTAHNYVMLSHATALLRELYRRYRTLPDYEALCRKIGPQQGWPYEAVVDQYREPGDWPQVLAWVDHGLEQLPEDSHYRAVLQDARGEALLHLDRPTEALETLQPLFEKRLWDVGVYLKLRQAAQATGRWDSLYPQLTAQIRAHVLATNWEYGFPANILTEAGVLGYAYLLEGAWQDAIAWASTPTIPVGWQDDDLRRTVAAALLRMALCAQDEPVGEVLAQTLQAAPEMVRDYGDRLESIAQRLSADVLLDGAVQLYEQLVEWAVGGKNRASYAQAGTFCKIIQAIRHRQGREAEFQRYYAGLFSTYSRRPAFKDELRKAIEGVGYRPKR